MTRLEDVVFVGREEELQNLIKFAHSAFSGEASVACVIGAAGIGKTSLVEKLFCQLRKEYADLVVLTSRCKHESASYYPFRSLIEDLLGARGINMTDAREIAEKQHHILQDVVIDVVQEIGAHVVEIFFPSAVAKIGENILKRQKTLSDMVLARSVGQVQVFGWYTRIMRAISQYFPLVLFLDDLHLADISSLNLLLHLGRAIEKDQMLVIGAYRPHKITPESLLIQIKHVLEHVLPVGTHRHHEATPEPSLIQIKTELERYGAQEFSLDVSQEDPEQAEKIVRFVHDYLIAKYGTNFSERFEEYLVEESGGNPLFLTEALIDFEEKGQLKKSSVKKAASESGEDMVPEQGWRLPTEFEYLKTFPETIEDLLSRRINRLDEESREILEYASVQGDEFIIEALSNIEPEQLAEVCQNLKSHRFILEKGNQLLPNGNSIHVWTFRHHLIKDYVYTQLSPEKKKRLHREIGKSLERLYKPSTSDIVPELATHFYHGQMPSRAVHDCLNAAKEANRRYGTPEAVRFGLMGLKTLEERPEVFSQKEFAENRWRLLLELAKAEEAGGDNDPAEDHIRTGIAYLDDNLPILGVANDKLHAEVHAQLGKLYVRQGTDMPKAKENFESALYIYEQQEDKRNMAELLYQLANIVPAKESIGSLEKSFSIAEELQDVELQIRCLHGLTEKYTGDDFSRAEKCAQQALQLATDLGKAGNYLLIEVLNLMASICRENGKFQTGIHYLEESLEIARRIGDILLEAAILNDLGFDYGRFVTLQEKARETLKESIVVRERAGFDKSAPFYNLGWIFTRQGQWKEAEECFQKALVESGETSQATYRGDIGCLYELQENYAQAEMELLYRLEVLDQQKRSHNLFGYTGIAQNYALSGNDTQSRYYLEKAYTLFEQETRPRKKWWCLYEIADGYRMLKEYDTAKTACRKSIEWFLNHAENAEDLIYLAGARLVMGKILVETEEHQEALAYLNKAKTAFETCQHYALGEALFYLGKAYQGTGNPQAQEYINQALAEFQRLKLHHKAHKAQELLEEITG